MTMSDGEAYYNQWLDSGLGKREFWRQHVNPHLTYDQFHGLTWRHAAKMGFPANPKLFDYHIGQALTVEGDAVICGDVQLPTTDYWFAQLVSAVGATHLKKPRRLIVAGDLFNLDSFSDYPRTIGLPSFKNEMAAARELIREWLTVFQDIIVIPGNHEHRLAKKSGGELMMAELMQMVTSSEKVRTSHWGHVVVKTAHGDWRCTHNANYSINQLKVADDLAQKFQQHIICHHQHHCAQGWDRFGRHVIIDNGGLFDYRQMAYAQLDDTKSAVMKPGFTLLKDGVPRLYSREPFTDWDTVLPAKARKRRAA